MQRNDQWIDIPDILNMGEFLNSSNTSTTEATSISLRYRLTAAILYYGNSREGHFVTLVRSKKNWRMFNDDEVKDIPCEEAVNNINKFGYVILFQVFVEDYSNVMKLDTGSLTKQYRDEFDRTVAEKKPSADVQVKNQPISTSVNYLYFSNHSPHHCLRGLLRKGVRSCLLQVIAVSLCKKWMTHWSQALSH